MHMKRSLLISTTLFLVLGTALAGGYIYKTQQFYQERVLPGIFVLETPLGNLTRTETTAAVNTIADTALHERVTLVLGEQQFESDLKALGYSINTEGIVRDAFAYGRSGDYLAVFKTSATTTERVPLRFSINRNTLRAYLASLTNALAPRDMVLAYQNNTVTIIPARDGWNIDMEGAITAITTELKPNQQHSIITIPGTSSKPRIYEYTQIADAHDRFTRLLNKTFAIPGTGAKLILTPVRIARMTSFEYVSKNGKDFLALRINPNALYEEVKALIYETPSTREGEDGSKVILSGTIPSPRTASSLVEQTAFVLARYTGESSFVSRSEPGITRSLEIDISAQRLYALENGKIIKTFIISSGTEDKPTPRGTFTILNHIPLTYADRYDLYVPYWMALRHSDGGYYGYGIHGLPYYEDGSVTGAEDLGTPVSHGCIRLGPSDEKFIYNWTMGHHVNVVIHD